MPHAHGLYFAHQSKCCRCGLTKERRFLVLKSGGLIDFILCDSCIKSFPIFPTDPVFHVVANPKKAHGKLSLPIALYSTSA